jgi:2-hydroxychromene-2-carboxylate isomerase
LSWPSALPEDLLGLARAATVAKRHGREVPFAIAGFRTLFVHGRDPSAPQEMQQLAADAGLEPNDLLHAIGEQSIKDELRRTTEDAHAAGVPGVPTVVTGTRVFWGDDRLDEAAAAVGRNS